MNRWDDRKPVFAGAGPPGMGTPWGTLAEIARRLLAPLGYDVQIEPESFGLENTRYVSDGRADFGATHLSRIRASFRGEAEFSAEGQRANLRLLATINHPSWVTVAGRRGSVLTDLAQLGSIDQPLQIKSGTGQVLDLLLQHYGTSRRALEERGATFYGFERGREVLSWARDGEFDLIVDTVYAAYTPEARHWWEASVFNDLVFFDLPEPVIAAVCATTGGRPARLPRHVVRGSREVAAVERLPQAYYARDDMPDDVAALIVETFDVGRSAFRSTHLPYSYDPANVADGGGVPLHPAAERYYRRVGYA